MKECLPIIKARSGLFRGIEESELEKLFGCLEVFLLYKRMSGVGEMFLVCLDLVNALRRCLPVCRVAC